MAATFLEAQGFDHLRIPIDEIELWNEEGARIEENFDEALYGDNEGL
ncbi:hypothetical protein MLD52_12920 [Puniceicoccaceae bacterium K14]|nr:hypothetical protein [Puniceicoccaceae bacterium K14]